MFRTFTSILLFLVALATAACAQKTGAEFGSNPPNGWIHAPSRERNDGLWQCAAYGGSWVVSNDGGSIALRRFDPRGEKQEPIPPNVSLSKKMIGRRTFKPTSRGWLAGFDAGEFGGGLWWFSRDGSKTIEVLSENVHAIYQINSTILILTGLNHLGLNYGHLYRFSDIPDKVNVTSVAYLLAADTLDPLRIRPLYQHGILKDAEFEVVESDSKWMGLMERAFGAPRYDSYVQKHYRLTRTVWNRDKNLSPKIVLYGLWYHAIPSLLNLTFFERVKIHEAQKARVAGDLSRAERLLGELDAFGMRIADGSGDKLEKLIGMTISRSADKELVDFYSSTGNAEDARRAALRIEQINERARSMRPDHDPATRAQAQAFQWEGILVQGFGILGVIAGFAALAGMLLLELWPARIRHAKTIWRRALCWIADYAPATLLVASAAFLMSFLPFQRAFAEYRSSSYVLANQERLMEALGDLHGVPDYVMGVNAHVLIWAFVTAALTAVLLFVLVNGILRPRHAASKPA